MQGKAVYIVVAFSMLLLGQASHDPDNSRLATKEQAGIGINLKPKSVVLGPKIRLGDLGNIRISDSRRKSKICNLLLGTAPPPGESTEITLSYIRRRLKTEGLGDFIPFVNGPKTMRVITAQNEIDKAFLREQLAYDQRHSDKGFHRPSNVSAYIDMVLRIYLES